MKSKGIPLLFASATAAILGSSCSPAPVPRMGIEDHAPAESMIVGGGITLKLLAVSDDFRKRSWTPQGEPLKAWVTDSISKGLVEAFPDSNSSRQREGDPEGHRTIYARIDGVPKGEMPSVVFRIPPSDEVGVGINSLEGRWGPPDSNSDEYWLAGVSKPFKGRAKAVVIVGLSVEPWRLAGAYRNEEGKFVHSKGSDFRPFVLDEDPPRAFTQKVKPPANVSSGPAISVTISIPDTSKRRAFRLVVFDKKGMEMRSAGSVTENDKDLPSEYWFQGRSQDVDRIELQYRNYEWKTFEGVRLQP